MFRKQLGCWGNSISLDLCSQTSPPKKHTKHETRPSGHSKFAFVEKKKTSEPGTKKRKRPEDPPVEPDEAQTHKGKRTKLVDATLEQYTGEKLATETSRKQKGKEKENAGTKAHQPSNAEAHVSDSEEMDIHDKDVDVVLETSEVDLPTKAARVLPLSPVDGPSLPFSLRLF